jgi:hypothetical protein
MTDRELLQQALAMLEDINQCSLPPTGIPLPAEIDHVMEALRARLAQPEPEPFGWVKIDEVRQHFDTAGCGTIYKTGGEGRVPLYTTPQREWVGLTDKEYEQAMVDEGQRSRLTFDIEVRAMIKEAVEMEREACAVIAFNAKTYLEAAAAIRARWQG